MAFDYGKVLTIMRRIIGENDGSDNNSTSDTILIDYISTFMQVILPQDLKVFDLKTFWEFNTVADQDEYTFFEQGFSNIEPPVYVNHLKISYWQNPDLFFQIWQNSDEDDEQRGEPTDVLFFDDKLLFRPKPDAIYPVKLVAYKDFSSVTQNDKIPQNYYLRYIAYGASLDYLSDFGNFEVYNQILPVFNRYRDLVIRRSSNQIRTQRPRPAL